MSGAKLYSDPVNPAELHGYIIQSQFYIRKDMVLFQTDSQENAISSSTVFKGVLQFRNPIYIHYQEIQS